MILPMRPYAMLKVNGIPMMVMKAEKGWKKQEVREACQST